MIRLSLSDRATTTYDFCVAANLLKHYHEKHEVAEIPDDLVDATTSNGAMPMGAFSVGGRADQMAAVAALCQSIDSQDSVSEISEGHHSAQLEFEVCDWLA